MLLFVQFGFDLLQEGSSISFAFAGDLLHIFRVYDNSFHTLSMLYLCFIYGFAMLMLSVDVAKVQNIIGLHNWVELAKTAEMVDVGSGCFEVGWAGYRFVVNFKIEDHGKAERDY